MAVEKSPGKLLMRALRGETLERVPVWMMRQAGRYLPEYRAIRDKSSFFEMVRTPELACEITLQPVRRLGVDAAIIFSDILVVPQALGLEVVMHEGSGPQFPNPIRHSSDLQRLSAPKVERDLKYVFDALKLTRANLDGSKALIGFAGAPWTLFAYMTQGSGSKSFSYCKRFMFSQSAATHQILDRLTTVTAEYLLGQIESGADCVQIFDSWAGLLSPEDYRKFSLPYLAKIVEKVSVRAPVIVFAKDAHFALEELAQLGASALSLDWSIAPTEARRRCPNITLQGNLDPTILYAEPDYIKSRVGSMLKEFGSRAYIANLGHGLLPDFEPDKVQIFVKAVQEHRWVEN